MVWIDLFEHVDSPSCPSKIDPLTWRIVYELVHAALAVQHINDLPRVRVHNHHLSRLIEVPLFHAATDKQPVMGCIEGEGMRQRPADDGPRGNDFAFFEVNDRNPTCCTKNDIHSLCCRIECKARGIVVIQRDAPGVSPGFGINDFDGTLCSLD